MGPDKRKLLSIALVKGAWLGAKTLGPPGGVPRLEDLADAFVYLGPVGSLRQSLPPPNLYRDAVYLAELERRDRIQGGYNSVELQRWKKHLFKAH